MLYKRLFFIINTEQKINNMFKMVIIESFSSNGSYHPSTPELDGVGGRVVFHFFFVAHTPIQIVEAFFPSFDIQRKPLRLVPCITLIQQQVIIFCEEEKDCIKRILYKIPSKHWHIPDNRGDP